MSKESLSLIVTKFEDGEVGDILKYELRVTSCQLRVTSCQLRIACCQLQAGRCELIAVSCSNCNQKAKINFILPCPGVTYYKLLHYSANLKLTVKATKI